jgi:hypothetical protein
MFRWPDPIGVWRASAGAVVGHGEAGSALGLTAMRACDAWAYLAVFCSASTQQKYTAASAS